MTIVVARRFGERIIIASDTMVSGSHGASSNIIPGRLKAIVLSPIVSVAYAGLSLQAIDAIRGVKKVLDAGGDLSATEALLIAASARHPGELDFIIAAHENGPALRKVVDGQITNNLENAAIGETSLVRAILEAEMGGPEQLIPSEYEAEIAFSRGFVSLFNDHGVQITSDVGGFPTFLLASPYGHTYQPHGGVAAWDIRRGGVPETLKQREDRSSGMTEWRYQVLPSTLRGAGVIGAIVPSAGVGYVYSPLEDDDAMRFNFDAPQGLEGYATSLAPLLDEINRRAEALGGIKAETGEVDSRPPTLAEINSILAHAAAAPFPTTITRVESGFQVACGNGTFTRMVLLGFSQMQPRPVEVACETIDRLNATISASVERARLGPP